MSSLTLSSSCAPSLSRQLETGWTGVGGVCLEIFWSWLGNSAAAAGVSSGGEDVAISGAPDKMSPLAGSSVVFIAQEGRLQFSSGGPIGLESCQPYWAMKSSLSLASVTASVACNQF